MNRQVSHLVVLGAVILIATEAFARGQDGQPKQPPETRAQAAAAQVKCPVTPTEDIDPEVFTDYKGKRIYFCCDRCRIRFTRDPEKYAARLVGAAPAPEPPTGSQEAEHAREHGAQGGDVVTPAAEPQKDADHHHDEPGAMPMGGQGAMPMGSEGAMPMGGDHDHKEHGPSTGPRWQKWLGGFHPPMVNFPIGVLVAGALAETLFILRRRSEFDHVARFCVVFAVVTGLAAGVLGWLFAGVRLTDTDPLLGIHRWLGTGAVLWLVALLWASERARRPEHPARALYRFFLFGGAALVSATGFFGGAMVYGLDHYLWR